VSKRKKKYASFKLNCFGFLGIILLIGGIFSAVFSFYAIKDLLGNL